MSGAAHSACFLDNKNTTTTIKICKNNLKMTKIPALFSSDILKEDLWPLPTCLFYFSKYLCFPWNKNSGTSFLTTLLCCSCVIPSRNILLNSQLGVTIPIPWRRNVKRALGLEVQWMGCRYTRRCCISLFDLHFKYFSSWHLLVLYALVHFCAIIPVSTFCDELLFFTFIISAV